MRYTVLNKFTGVESNFSTEEEVEDYLKIDRIYSKLGDFVIYSFNRSPELRWSMRGDEYMRGASGK